MSSLYSSSVIRASEFRNCLVPFLQAPGLPFAEVLSEQDIAAAFAAENVSFGEDDEAVYTPGITLWAFLSQMVFLGELRSCAAAVARVIVFLTSLGRKAPSADTGNYCRARQKLPEGVLMAQHRVGHRTDRVEPHVVKRRPKKQRLMMKPRRELQAELLAGKSRG